MANEEQRRAFASYMGTGGTASTTRTGQQVPQYPGAFANSSNPYLFQQQQFPGAQGFPAAPTPPPAAPSSVASYPAYQGGYSQPGFPQAGLAHGGFGHNAFPQRPPPLGQSDATFDQQPTSAAARQAGYTQVPGNYGNQIPQGYNGAWQHTDPMVQQTAPLNGEAAHRGAMVPSSRNVSGEIVESRSKHSNEYYRYQQYGQTGPQAAEAHPPIDSSTVPVLLCHTCSVCGSMRSAGFHRNNPVIPGKSLVLTPCRRCKKKIKIQQRSQSSFTRIRSCTAKEPCDWPREPIRADMEHSEHRGRRRSQEDVYVYRHAPARPRIIRQSSSQTRMGLRVLQQDRSPPRVLRNEARIRVSSLSPRRASRYDDETWPPPDIVRMRASRSDEVQPKPQSNPNIISRDDVWPPPDIVRTHSYRKAASPPPRPSSRIIELSPSPPPVRTRPTRVVYRSESEERRPRSLSPVRVRIREERRSENAEARLLSHPRPFRPVTPSQREFMRSSDNIADPRFVAHERAESPGRGILKSPGGEHETSRRQTSMRESQQSTSVEVGGPRVHFGSRRRESERLEPESRGRPRYVEESRQASEDYEHFRNYSRHRRVDASPLQPPVEQMDRMRIRRSSLSPQRSSEEEIRIDRARRISPSPPPVRYERVRVRHVAPLPTRDRAPRPPASPPSPERTTHIAYRHVSRDRVLSCTRSVTPPPMLLRKSASEDMTDTDSAHSGDVVEVRRWRGIDEDGKPCMFVEERRNVRLIEQGSERGSAAEFRPLNEGVARGSWRDV